MPISPITCSRGRRLRGPCQCFLPICHRLGRIAHFAMSWVEQFGVERLRGQKQRLPTLPALPVLTVLLASDPAPPRRGDEPGYAPDVQTFIG
jgi:hypothetical protein